MVGLFQRNKICLCWFCTNQAAICTRGRSWLSLPIIIRNRSLYKMQATVYTEGELASIATCARPLAWELYGRNVSITRYGSMKSPADFDLLNYPPRPHVYWLCWNNFQIPVFPFSLDCVFIYLFIYSFIFCFIHIYAFIYIYIYFFWVGGGGWGVITI